MKENNRIRKIPIHNPLGWVLQSEPDEERRITMASRKTKKMLRTGAVLALSLSGCGVDNTVRQPRQTTSPVEMNSKPDSEKPAPDGGVVAGLKLSVQQSLDRLNALQLFAVDGLVMNLPANATACYGVPCPGDTAGQAVYDAELARQTGRLSKLADQAESCNSGNCYVYTPNSAEEAVQALNALEIVDVGSLVVAQPQNNPNCYNLPCEPDIQAANQENQSRATLAFTIASYAKSF